MDMSKHRSTDGARKYKRANPKRALIASDRISRVLAVSATTTTTTETKTSTSTSVHLNTGVKRAPYACAHCHKPKRGHVCTGVDSLAAISEPVWAADPSAIAASDANFAARLQLMTPSAPRLPPRAMSSGVAPLHVAPPLRAPPPPTTVPSPSVVRPPRAIPPPRQAQPKRQRAESTEAGEAPHSRSGRTIRAPRRV